jgi:hypothetical protein
VAPQLARELRVDPVFGASMLAVAGYGLFFITHRADLHYFPVVMFFGFLVLAL